MNEELINGIAEKVSERLAINTKAFLTTKEAAQYLQTSPSNLHKMTARREIPHYKPGGKACYFKRSDLDKWISSCKVASKYEISMKANNH